MAGYMLIEERMMQPLKPTGIPSHPNCMGMLDYLRELREDAFPFTVGYKLRVVGLEDVLKAAGDRPDEVAGSIHQTLAARANELERMGGFVQVSFKSKLYQADDFWFEIGTRRISLRSIFGHVRKQYDNGIEYYLASFNLT